MVKVFKAEARGLIDSWNLEKERLQQRSLNTSLPKPTWHSGPSDSETPDSACKRREREEVAWQLLSASRREGGVRTCRVFHGCSTWEAAKSICRSGFASNVQTTKGWFGEGMYTTLSAPYALRYALGMRDFWEQPGAEGLVIVAKLVYAQVYPVTQADNDTPLKPGLKGKQIAAADGALGCDCQFVCVRRHPPFGNRSNFTYHACSHGERPDATEIVVNQEARILPEYIVMVQAASLTKCPTCL